MQRRPAHLGRLPVRYVPWSEQVEAPFLASISLGLMPLDDGEWERGKCSFKMLQYMAAGRPCIVSPVGMNRDILAEAEIGRAATTPAEWVEALCGLLADRNEAERLGAAGRELAVSDYSVAAVAPRLRGAAAPRRIRKYWRNAMTNAVHDHSRWGPATSSAPAIY